MTLVAIVRIDHFQSNALLRDKISVPKLVGGVDDAVAEVARLNKLNGPKGAEYFWVHTRVKEPGIVNIVDERLKIHSPRGEDKR